MDCDTFDVWLIVIGDKIVKELMANEDDAYAIWKHYKCNDKEYGYVKLYRLINIKG